MVNLETKTKNYKTTEHFQHDWLPGWSEYSALSNDPIITIIIWLLVQNNKIFQKLKK